MQRKRHSAEFKAQAVLKALSGEMPTTEIAKRFGVHPIMITQWKKHVVDLLPSTFSKKPEHEREEWAQRESELFQQLRRRSYS
jgi:transposase